MSIERKREMRGKRGRSRIKEKVGGVWRPTMKENCWSRGKKYVCKESTRNFKSEREASMES